MDSVLNSVKVKNGIDPSCTDFDDELIMDINTSLAVLSQIGVIDYKTISNEYDTWGDIHPTENINLEMVKTYVALKVRSIFDAPVGSLAEANKETLRELEIRMYTEAGGF